MPQLVSIPSAILILGIAPCGLLWGLETTFGSLYLQRELGASSQFISYKITITGISVVCMLPFSEFIIGKMGEANAILFRVIVSAGQLLTYSLV